MKYKIAIFGNANSGKNTVAELIIKHLDLKKKDYKIVAFAEPMKAIIKIAIPSANEECLYGKSELRTEIIPGYYLDNNGEFLTHRKALTDLGAFFRKYNEQVWIKCLDYDFKKSEKQCYIVSDGRFINEFNYLKGQGFILIKVKRNGLGIGTDVSETEQKLIPDESFDYIINNDKSLKKLSKTIKRMLANLNG
jgi:hypothetical protein